MKLLLAAAFGLTVLTTVPAAAAVVTYDALAAFTDQSSTSGPFTFGSVTGSTFSAFPTGGACLLQNTTCLTSGDYLGVYKSIDGAAHPGSGTVDVPGDALILHPGATGAVAAIFFTAPTSAVYNFSLSAFQATNVNANSVQLFGYSGFADSAFPSATLTAASPTYGFSFPALYLAAGQTIGIGVGYDGNYQYDATGVRFTLTTDAVPEPASWALMIVGFGAVGAMTRRRRALSLA